MLNWNLVPPALEMMFRDFPEKLEINIVTYCFFLCEYNIHYFHKYTNADASRQANFYERPLLSPLKNYKLTAKDDSGWKLYNRSPIIFRKKTCCFWVRTSTGSGKYPKNHLQPSPKYPKFHNAPSPSPSFWMSETNDPIFEH